MNTSSVIDIETSIPEMKSPRPEATGVVDLHILVSRIAADETRARCANLPLPEKRASTVREALQLVIDDARHLITENLARDNHVPWIDPPTPAEENESRFVIPLSL